MNKDAEVNVELGQNQSGDLYCEIERPLEVNKDKTVVIHWKVRNTGKKPWPQNLSLFPVMSKPLMRTFYASNISGLAGESEAELTVKIDIPA